MKSVEKVMLLVVLVFVPVSVIGITYLNLNAMQVPFIADKTYFEALLAVFLFFYPLLGIAFILHERGIYNISGAEEKATDDALLKSIGDGVLALDKQGRIIKMNQAAETMLGRDFAELNGKRFVDVIQVVDEEGKPVPSEKRLAHVVLTSGQIVTVSSSKANHYFVRKDGSRFPVAITVSPVVVNGNLDGVIEVFRDITHDKDIDRVKTEFISLASHQLRTPVWAINWSLETLLGGEIGKLTAKQNTFVKKVYQHSQQMMTLLNSLLNISRIESGKMIIEPKPVDLPPIIKEVIDMLEVDSDEKKQKLIFTAPAKLPPVLADAKLIREVYVNFLTNAIKYSPKGAPIRVTLSVKDGTVLTEIKDQGYGIPQDEQEQVFKKFYRGKNIAKVVTEGIGLGLYLSKIVVESSHGEIGFTSEEGKGTTFWFTLPLAK